MSNRIIREGLIDSDRVARLSAEGERFYVHLMLKADDHGHYDGRITMLRNTLFPARSDITEQDVERCLRECVTAELLELWKTPKGPVVRVTGFNQKIRARTRWPIEKDAAPMHPTVEQARPKVAPDPVEPAAAPEGEKAEAKPAPIPTKTKRMEKARPLLFYLNEKADRSFRESEMNLLLIAARLEEVGNDIEGVKVMIDRQCARWKSDAKMAEYLRPETLFGKQKFPTYYDNRNLPVAHGDQRGNPHHNTTRRISSERDEFIFGTGQDGSKEPPADHAGNPQELGQQPEI